MSSNIKAFWNERIIGAIETECYPVRVWVKILCTHVFKLESVERERLTGSVDMFTSK